MLLSDEQGRLWRWMCSFRRAIAPNATGSPFWVARGAVQAALSPDLPRDNSSKEMAEFWSVPRLFYVPAYRLPVEEVVAAGIEAAAPAGAHANRGGPAPFTRWWWRQETCRPIAEFIVMSIEAERKDA